MVEYKWKAFSVTSLAVIMASVDSTIVLLALYPLKTSLQTSFVTIVWVVLAYLLISTTFGLTLGRLGDLFGRKRMFNAGFVVFTLGSAFCALSQTGLQLVGFRAVQGFGSALIMSNAFAIISEAFPPRERGKAFGFNAVVWGGGSILGIVLGGVILNYSTWPVLFLINIPVGIVGTLWAYVTLKPSAPRAPDAPPISFDLPAAITFTAGILSLLIGVSWGLLNDWSGLVMWASFVSCPLFFAFLIVWEARYAKDPILHGEFFKNRIFTSSVSAAFLQSLAIFAVNFLLLFYFEGVKGISPLNAALLVVPMAVMTCLFGPLGGIMSDRIGPKYVATSGVALQALVLLLFTRITLGTPLWEVAVMEAVYGIGGGIFWPANTATIMSAVPPAKFGVGSGIMNTFRNTGMVMSFAVALTAITVVVPVGFSSGAWKGIIYQVFIGSSQSALTNSEATAYLAGQAFAYTISFVLLLVAGVLVFLTAPGKRASAQGWSTPSGPPPVPRLAAEPLREGAAPEPARARESS